MSRVSAHGHSGGLSKVLVELELYRAHTQRAHSTFYRFTFCLDRLSIGVATVANKKALLIILFVLLVDRVPQFDAH